MNKTLKRKLENKAKELKREMGGKIFTFPIEEDDPFSKFGFVAYYGKKYLVFEELMDITEVAQGILEMSNFFKRNGIKIKYEEDVRFVVYEAQKNAPSVTMKRLRDAKSFI